MKFVFQKAQGTDRPALTNFRGRLPKSMSVDIIETGQNITEERS